MCGSIVLGGSIGSCTAPGLEPENLLILWLSTEPSNNDGEDTGPEDIPLVGFPSTNKESLVIPIYTRSPYAL